MGFIPEALLYSFWCGRAFKLWYRTKDCGREGLYRCASSVSNQADEDLAELRVDTIGFLVTRVDVEDGEAATTVAAEAQVLSALQKCIHTADDLVVAVGHAGVILLLTTRLTSGAGSLPPLFHLI